MARINIDEEFWSDRRRPKLILKLGSEFMADGVMLTVWKLAELYWCPGKSPIPIKAWDEAGIPDSVIEVGFAERRTDGIYVRGSEERFAWRFVRQEAGSKGGKAKASNAKQAVAKPSKKKQNVASSSLSSSLSSSSSVSSSTSLNSVGSEPVGVAPSQAFIAAYSTAYKARYGEAARPSLDGKTVGLIKQFVQDTPIERAVLLVETFLTMNDAWFITKAHDFGTFRENLTKIGLALDTGRSSTATQARMAEKSSHAQDQLRRIAEGKL